MWHAYRYTLEMEKYRHRLAGKPVSLSNTLETVNWSIQLSSKALSVADGLQ